MSVYYHRTLSGQGYHLHWGYHLVMKGMSVFKQRVSYQGV
jgi:hypothetical protein